MNISLKDKKALVCGATQGIGLAVAQELASLGAECILLARNEQSLRAAVQSLNDSAGQRHHFAVADFFSNDEVRKAVQDITAEHTVHILVNNTGGPKPGAIIEEEEPVFEKAFQQHLLNNHILTKAVVPGMKQEGYGRIVNIISTSVKIPIHNLGVSNTTRAAVAAWAKTMSIELGRFNITVNNILPGNIDTQRLRSLITANAAKNNRSEEEQVKEMEDLIPMKRFGTAAEVAAMAAFLASPAASYINGVSIQVDGGATGTLS